MNTVTLTLSNKPELFLECNNVTPDAFSGKSIEEIASLDVWEGKYRTNLGEFFTVEGKSGATADETSIVVKGDCTRVKRIGQQMTGGEIMVEGNADMYTGGWMKGGKIHIKGNVDSFCGIGMEGGEILIEGDAGNHVGSSYRGEWRGMQGGLIRIKGNAGSDTATFMNGGTIIIGGNTFIHVSTHAEGGTVIIKGDAKSRVGGQMVKGNIYVFGSIETMLPGFRYVDDVEEEVDGENAIFKHYVGDLGERHPKRKGETIYGNLYVKK